MLRNGMLSSATYISTYHPIFWNEYRSFSSRLKNKRSGKCVAYQPSASSCGSISLSTALLQPFQPQAPCLTTTPAPISHWPTNSFEFWTYMTRTKSSRTQPSKPHSPGLPRHSTFVPQHNRHGSSALSPTNLPASPFAKCTLCYL